MNNIDIQYQQLLQDILDNGVKKTDRTETGTLSVFGRQIRHKMSEGFPLLTTKKMAWKSIVTELLWFLQGSTNIKYLVDNGCHIWDGDAYKNYLKNSSTSLDGMYLSKEEFIHHVKNNETWGKKWGELGPIYGKQWRQWQGWMEYGDEGRMGSLWYDQIQRLIHMLKTDPDSRRLMVSAWNVAELDQMVLPPCHYGFQVYTQEREGNRYISLMWNQRSVDTFLGLPFNIASYGLLLTLLGKLTNMVPDELIGNLGDTHLYLNHIDQAKQQIGRELSYEERYHTWFANNYETGFEYNESEKVDFDNPYWTPTPKRTKEPFPLPEVNLNFEFQYLDGYIVDWAKVDVNSIELINYKSHPTIKAPLSN